MGTWEAERKSVWRLLLDLREKVARIEQEVYFSVDKLPLLEEEKSGAEEGR